MIRLFAGILIFLLSFVSVSVITGNPIMIFVNFSAFFVSFFMIFGSFVASEWTIEDFMCALQTKTCDNAYNFKLIDMLAFLEKISIISAVIGIISGGIIALSVLADASRLGPALAVTLLIPLYCLLFYVFAAVLKAKLNFKALKK